MEPKTSISWIPGISYRFRSQYATSSADLIARPGFSPKKSKQTRIGGKNNTGRGSIVSNLNAFLFSSRHKSANLNGLRRLKTVGVLRLETGGLIPPKLTGMNGRRITLSIDAQPSNVK